jgi:hypothetical protein
MRSSELLAAGYALIFLVAGLLVAGRRPRAWRTVGLALAGLCVAVLAPLSTLAGGESLRAWWLLGFLPLAYWMPAPLAYRPDQRLEAWLLSVDQRLGLGPVVHSPALELSYFLVYFVVPIGLGAVLISGGLSAEHYWRGVLLAVMPCYGLLPLVTTRPPRALLLPSSNESAPREIRRLNVRFLAIFGNQWNTVPSGHAAGAVAIAVMVWQSGSPAAPVVALLAGGICIGTVSGRYHYAVDTVLGALLGLAAGTLLR